ncbi:MAG: type II toxin-antitoxin system VapC family toxin [Puniceicoccales bacterium]
MSVLVDTSVWIDHLRKGDDQLVNLLKHDLVVVHPYVLGEIACGQLRNREEILDSLSGLPQARKADDDEILRFIKANELYGRGIGLVDIHLLASARLDRLQLWTRDKRLREAAEEFELTL